MTALTVSATLEAYQGASLYYRVSVVENVGTEPLWSATASLVSLLRCRPYIRSPKHATTGSSTTGSRHSMQLGCSMIEDADSGPFTCGCVRKSRLFKMILPRLLVPVTLDGSAPSAMSFRAPAPPTCGSVLSRRGQVIRSCLATPLIRSILLHPPKFQAKLRCSPS
jgi:hypothetical protein